MNIPISIDELDWRRLSLHISKARSMTPEQRDIHFENVRQKLPQESEELGNALFALTDSLYNCREFHKLVRLDYNDPKRENGQIIRVALIGFLEYTINKGEAITLSGQN